MFKSLSFGLLWLMAMTSPSFGQELKFKTILKATETCKTPAQFTQFIEPYGFCFHEKKEMPTYTYYTHFKCGLKEIGLEEIRVNFSVSNDGSLNSSFLTRNEAMVNGFQDELEECRFRETQENTGEPRENALWFTSEDFPGILILWEYHFDELKRKVWHIGFVWNSPESE